MSCVTSRLPRPGLVLYRGDQHGIIQTALKVNIFLADPTSRQGGHRFSGPEMFSTQQPEAVGSCSALCCGCQTLLPKTRVCSVLFSQPQVFWPASFSLFPFSSLIKTTGGNGTQFSSAGSASAFLVPFHHVLFYYYVLSLMNHKTLVLWGIFNN